MILNGVTDDWLMFDMNHNLQQHLHQLDGPAPDTGARLAAIQFPSRRRAAMQMQLDGPATFYNSSTCSNPASLEPTTSHDGVSWLHGHVALIIL